MRFVFLVALAALSACGPPQARTYPPQYELSFMQNCQSQPGASTALCGCMWDGIETQVPVDDFIAFEQAPLAERENHPVYEQLEQFALACRAQLQAPTDDPPPP